MASDELWHLIEARRDDGAPTLFRIREIDPRLDLPNIFVIELPYPVSDEEARLPDAASYRRLRQFEEQWLTPAATAQGWTFVAAKTEDGSFFLYLYGAGDSARLAEALVPFDDSLVFFNEVDASWEEYGALREILDEAKAMPAAVIEATEPPPRATMAKIKPRKPKPKPKATVKKRTPKKPKQKSKKKKKKKR